MINVVIPMAGAGTRFQKSGIYTPKPLIKVLEKSLIEHSIDSFDIPDTRFIFITRTFDNIEDNITLSEIFSRRRPEHIEIKLSAMTSGATETVLSARELINNDDPLIIYNCDQLITWNADDFYKFILKNNPDSALVLYNNNDPKNSFAKINTSHHISKVVEKHVISNHALIGFHYWKAGKFFVNSADTLMSTFRTHGHPECYISETFNYLPTDHQILPYHVADNIYVPLGTPEDVARYVGMVKEFKTDKPKTLMIDIDGTILRHMHSITKVYTHPAEILPGVIEKINNWDSNGYQIIFMTARKESTREHTEKQLRQFGLAWDQLIMGIGGGDRYIINDKLYATDTDRAIGINVITNQGFQAINWEFYDL